MSVFSKKKIKDFIIYGLGQAINIVSPLFVMPLIILKCGQENFGKVGVGFSFAMILNGIIDYGSYINGVKDISINRENVKALESKINAIYLSKVILLLIVLLAVLIGIEFIPFLYKNKTLFLLSLIIVVGQLINPIWFFQGIENFKWISFVNLISKVIYIVLVFLFINIKTDYIYVNFYFGIAAIIGNSIGLIWLYNYYSFSFRKISFQPAFAIIKEEFDFSLSQVFLSLYQFSPIILISYIGGDFMAGQFRVIDQIISLFKTYLNMFFYFVYANICFELSKSIKKGISVWKQYNGFNFLLLFSIMLLFYFQTDFILSYFKIEKNQLPFLSFHFKLALLIPFLISISISLRQLMFAFNENKIYVKITIGMTILNFIFIFILIKLFGLKGVFLSSIIIELITITLYLFILKKHPKKIESLSNGI